MNTGFFGLLQIVFIGLKVTNYIDWSWWLVLLPFWLWIAIVVVYIILTAWLSKNDPLWRFRK